jgi:hypothetical protein
MWCGSTNRILVLRRGREPLPQIHGTASITTDEQIANSRQGIFIQIDAFPCTNLRKCDIWWVTVKKCISNDLVFAFDLSSAAHKWMLRIERGGCSRAEWFSDDWCFDATREEVKASSNGWMSNQSIIAITSGPQDTDDKWGRSQYLRGSISHTYIVNQFIYILWQLCSYSIRLLM